MSSDKHQYTWGDWQAIDREGFRGWWRGAYDHKGKLKDEEWRSDDTTPRRTDDYAQISQQFGQVSLQDETYYTQHEDYTTQNTELADSGNADFRSAAQSGSKSQKGQLSSTKSSEKHKPGKSSRDTPSKPVKPASSSKGAPPPKHPNSSVSSSSSSSSSRAQPDRKSAKPRYRIDDDDEEGYGHRQTMPPLVEGQEYTGGYDEYRGGGSGGPAAYQQSHTTYAAASADADYGSYRTQDAGTYGASQGDYDTAGAAGQGDWRESGYPDPRLPPSRHHGSRAYSQNTRAAGDEIEEDYDELLHLDYYHQERPRDTSPGAYAPAEPRDESKHAPKGDRTIMGTQGYYEELDPRYVIEHSSKFQVGEVFKVLWSEPYGSGRKQTRDTMKSLTERDVRENYGEKFWVGFRRFIVVATDEGHSTCVPILTYERKACTKKGVKAAKHGIVYTEGKKPQVLPKEPDLGFAPVRMRMNSDVRDEKLAPESRINYSKLVTVEHNVKVFFIGHIIGEDIMLVSDAVDSCWSHKKRSRPKGR